jgi:glyoxalase family protein
MAERDTGLVPLSMSADHHDCHPMSVLLPVITGLHHVTAFAGSPVRNLTFYTAVLGLRLVKRTVNFDDPFLYHLYYGDSIGTPGTLLTHFPQPNAARARHGTSEIGTIDLTVPSGALGTWERRLRIAGIHSDLVNDGQRDGVAFEDPDGTRYRLVEGEEPARDELSLILGVDGVALHVPDADGTAQFLTEFLGFKPVNESGGHHELRVGAGGSDCRLTVIHDPNSPHERMAAGTVHHIAWRVPNEAAQIAASEHIRAASVAVTPIIDRQYFQSIYFRIPGGIVFEIATDGPGFGVDEPIESLGSSLKLPPQHEPKRAAIERHLVPLETP